ncbi:hypothetical protein [Desulfosarcina ovata]|uniref:AraC-type arabinose-binding/dimerisation domain-containing protein n=1 Tax=Desulfosarcina ovata subsp. ovata TaxID=2752305 RepID=A0A5K8AGP9_9BACT|nr:hypothetical protein [Desulfosarcina ovata]BBO91865.1 hypothetical protein DSCOOX_50450 [Desulfosarcina ovata subsp. ovata]
MLKGFQWNDSGSIAQNHLTFIRITGIFFPMTDIDEAQGQSLQNSYTKIDFTSVGMDVRTLAGTMASCSTEALHTHGHHQVLKIESGVTLLVDAYRRQPMFGALTAFIPADFAHRSVVLGSPVRYKSIYLARELLPFPQQAISLFFISP